MIRIVLHIAIFSTCLTAYGQEWRDSLDLARTAYEEEDYMKALKYYESAQKKAPEDIDLSDEMAQSAYKAREFERAEKIYQQSGGAQNSNIKKADNFHNLGNSRMKQENYQGAIEAYKESMRLNPNDDQTRYNLSEAIRKLKDQQKNNGGQDGNQGNQDGQDGQDGQGDQNGNQNGNQDGNQGNQNGNQGNQNGNQGGSGNNNSEGGQNNSTLPNRTVDRMLDKLMKDEAETKRKMNGGQGKNSQSASGKDW